MGLTLLLPLGYFISLLFNKWHRYVHYAVPALAVLLYFVYPSFFNFYDEGHAYNITLPVLGMLGLTFGMYYVRNRYFYNTILVINFLSNLPAVFICAMIIWYAIRSIVA